jgi:hypothetical protein
MSGYKLCHSPDNDETCRNIGAIEFNGIAKGFSEILFGNVGNENAVRIFNILRSCKVFNRPIDAWSTNLVARSGIVNAKAIEASAVKWIVTICAQRNVLWNVSWRLKVWIQISSTSGWKERPHKGQEDDKDSKGSHITSSTSNKKMTGEKPEGNE